MLQRRIGKDTSVIMQDNNPTVLLQFLSYKSALQNCSQNTVLEYELDLILFFRFIIASRTGKIKELESISIEGVDEEFINSVREKSHREDKSGRRCGIAEETENASEIPFA